MSSPATHANAELPAVDERLVAPESGYEIDDGKLVRVPPSDEPHGTRHSKISALVEAHAGADFDVASDMLTRTSETTDIAPDVSVFPCARDRRTGGRQLEELAFEVVSTESLGHAGRRAATLIGRGVRRVFAIDVERVRALEWSPELGSWIVLDPRSYIEDSTLGAPLPVAALVHAAKADDAMAKALRVKRNPEFEAEREEGRAEGRKQGREEGREQGVADGMVRGRADALITVLVSRGLDPRAEERERILGERDPARLDRWLVGTATCASVAELLATA